MDGIKCGICSNLCIIGEGEKGYCGLRWNQGGLETLSDRSRGLYHAYLDPHITNCCSAWFCPGATGAGYPRYSYRDREERGYSNLAVFFYGCNFNCLFCQNPTHKSLNRKGNLPADNIIKKVANNPKISCICFFGGSPEPQLPFAINASEKALEGSGDKPLRICFEWNGCGGPLLAERAAELSLQSGGNLKFDLKCFSLELSIALSGVPNEQAYNNFKMVAEKLYPERRELPVLTATTLLVPGYVDSEEVEAIASFIANLDTSIPYSLLIFHPAYMMQDLPVTPLKVAAECYKAAKIHLEKVHVGNLHLIGIRSMSRFNSIARKF